MTVGDRIKEIRQNIYKYVKYTSSESITISQKSLTQKEFAKRLGISNSYLCDLEKNRKYPSGRFLKSLKEVFGVSSDWVLYGKKDNSFFFDDRINNILFTIKTAIPPFWDKSLDYLIKQIQEYKNQRKKWIKKVKE